ncbi:MAG TPA: hypothetical protein VNX40_02855 [Mucilaginibacter sp.]|jgi:hypothetical protein|nr:hypothetical protein [Mucilaginibacter sp.]
MGTSKKFSKETPIHVSVPSNLTLEQTNAITAAILREVGCPRCYSGFRFTFGEEVQMITARVAENNEVSIESLS